MIFILEFIHRILNHIFVIPFSLIAGLNKTYAFFIAFFIDLIQILIYFGGVHSKLEKSKLFGNLINKLPQREQVENYKTVRFFRRLGYIGVFSLAAMPLYFGGIWISFVLSTILNLNRKKAVILIMLGSAAGCFILTHGTIELSRLIVRVFAG